MIGVSKLVAIKNGFFRLTRPQRVVAIILLACLAWFIFAVAGSKKNAGVTYQTGTVEKGTLIVAVDASGQASTANSASVTTQTSGVVSKIYVQNGQKVATGDPIAEVELDMDGRQRSAQALAGYQSAKNALDNANTSLYTLQSTLFTEWKSYMDAAQSSTYQNSDGSPKTEERTLPQYMSTYDDWLASEAKYKTQQNVIVQAQTSLTSAWASYQQASPVIYAPISGTISGLSLQVGSVLSAQTGSSGNSAAQRIANIKTEATPTVTVNLTQIDAPKIATGNKATVTFDAFPDKTYTGVVVSIDTTGSVSSGVTTYPAVIKLDTGSEEIFPNMSAQASIITQVKDNAILVPAGAVSTVDGSSTVRIMKNGTPSEVMVELGLSSDTQTEILSGVSEGDTVVTGTTTQGSTQSTTRSVFSSFGGGAGAGGSVRFNR